MARYKRNGFKDDPSVSAELVKFMAVNTGFELLDSVAAKVKSMDLEIVAAKKEMLLAVKTAAAAGNKTDELKKLVDLLVKRVVKLEK
jgi:hypothetical protein